MSTDAFGLKFEKCKAFPLSVVVSLLDEELVNIPTKDFQDLTID